MNISSKTAIEIEEATQKENLRRIEAILFISGKFLNMQEIISLSDLNPMAIRESLTLLKERYEKSESSIEIIEKNSMWKMDVRQEYCDLVTRLATGSAEFTKAEQETLAIVAYKQPIKQSVVVKIRGNKAYDHLSKFESLGLIRRKKEGHTNILTTSEEFYDYFGVHSENNPFEKENEPEEPEEIE